MKKSGKRLFDSGSILITAFAVWTFLVLKIDVQPCGVNGTKIGFATMNCWFHKLTGVHMELYHITDWMGLIPIAICIALGCLGLTQLIKRKSLFKVDYDMIVLGLYYMLVVFGYLFFERIPINYRPVLIDGCLEVSYPSSTTLLVLCVMPTLMEQMERRINSKIVKRCIKSLVHCFSVLMVLARTISGVHWLTDIIGAILLSAGLFCVYKAVIIMYNKDKTR